MIPYIPGIDTSHHNEDGKRQINWQQVYDSGIRHVWIKATQGAGYVDTEFKNNRAEIEQVPFTTVSFYHWIDSSDPIMQATHHLRTIGTLKTNQGSMVDIENSPLVAPLAVLYYRNYIENFHKIKVQNYVGYFYNGGYNNFSFLNDHEHPWILPAFISESRMLRIVGTHIPDVWQSSSKITVPGVEGYCDYDRIFNEYKLISATKRPASMEAKPDIEDAMRYNYNGVQIAYNNFEIRRINSQTVADMTQTQVIDRDHMKALLQETGVHRANQSPFDLPGFEDAELNALWG